MFMAVAILERELFCNRSATLALHDRIFSATQAALSDPQRAGPPVPHTSATQLHDNAMRHHGITGISCMMPALHTSVWLSVIGCLLLT
jgi:hypothetical protein